MKYEQVCMATQEEEEYTDLLETMIEHNDDTKTPLLKEKLPQVINMIMAETKEEERNANNVTTETFIHTLATTNAPKEKNTLQIRGKFLWTDCQK